MSICVAGRFPPPIGGVSVYVTRRYAGLLKASEQVTKLDFSEKNFLLNLFNSKAQKYEVNSLNLFVVLAFLFLGKIRNSVFIDHNASRHYSGIKRKLLLAILKYCDGIYVVNPKLVLFYPPQFNVELISPFLPPDESEYNSIVENYPEPVKTFINDGSFTVNSAWKYIPCEGEDLYGVGTSLKLLDAIPSMKLLLVIGIYEPEILPEECKELIEKHIESGRLCILTGQHQLWPVFKKKPTCLRLTPTDGDSVSVREALYFSCLTIASNSIARPKGCVSYEYDSFEDLKRVLIEHL
ncbi:hypothetical protein [Colwellia sp. 20A7]|uniref:hypothetical protein n=1 Tax=Colwellia sp. 20A7 TaxID=2689569 RepID=UPI00135A5583|nr:hypothetical protein [Colwellia sp. 20A7]